MKNSRFFLFMIFSLTFAASQASATENKASQTETATFGMGCFWHSQEAFDHLPGVIDTQVGFSGGKADNPTYQQVCTDQTGHAEVVQVIFDPAWIAYKDLLRVFWKSHDPTQRDRQGPDVGKQYRSVIFFHSSVQEAILKESLAEFQTEGIVPREIVTEFKPAETFYPAEDYHQDYYAKKRGKTK